MVRGSLGLWPNSRGKEEGNGADAKWLTRKSFHDYTNTRLSWPCLSSFGRESLQFQWVAMKKSIASNAIGSALAVTLAVGSGFVGIPFH